MPPSPWAPRGRGWWPATWSTPPVAERLELTEETIELLVTKGAAVAGLGRLHEAIVTLTGAIAAASALQLPATELRARVNLSFAATAEDPQLAYRTAREGMALAQKLGMRGFGNYLINNATELAIRVGDWDWALPELEEASASADDRMSARLRRAEILGLRGEDVAADLQELAEFVASLTELQSHSSVAEVRAIVALAAGDFQAALDLARTAYRTNLPPDAISVQTAVRSAAALGDADAAREALSVIADFPGRVADATRHEGTAVLAGLEGRRDDARAAFGAAIRQWEELGLGFEAALGRLSLVTVLGVADPAAQAAAEAAGAAFTHLGARPLLDRLEAAVAGSAAPQIVDRVASGVLAGRDLSPSDGG